MYSLKPIFIALVLAATVFAGCVSPVPEEFDDAVTSASMAGLDAQGLLPRIVDGYVTGFIDVMADPTMNVHGEVYLPDVSKALAGAVVPEKFPTVLVLSPYNGAGSHGEIPGHYLYAYLVTELVHRGYAVVIADIAGTGGSGGCWDFMGPDEQKSAVAIVEGIAEQSWSDGKVGMIGKSYDGMTQIMAASRGAAHLVTIVPVAPLTHSYAGLYMNGVHYGGGWYATTTAYHSISATPPGDAPNERYPGFAQSIAKTPACIAQNTILGNDPTGSYNPYFEARDFRPLAKDVKASVFFMQGFLDPAVKPDNMFPWFNDVPTAKKAWIGFWQHDYANATWAGRDDMYLTLNRWFDHELKGAANGIGDELGVDIQDSLGRWRREAAWPPADAVEQVFGIGGDGKLLQEGAATGAIKFGGATSVATLAEEGDLKAARIESEPLTATLHVAGQPTLTLKVASDRTGGNVIARLTDVSPDGSERMISQGAMNLQFVKGFTTPTPLTPMSAVTASFALYQTDYVIEAGHSIALVLATQDPTTWFTVDAHLAELTLAGGPDSMLKLPTITRTDEDVLFTACGARVKEATPDCYNGELRDVRADRPPA